MNTKRLPFLRRRIIASKRTPWARFMFPTIVTGSADCPVTDPLRHRRRREASGVDSRAWDLEESLRAGESRSREALRRKGRLIAQAADEVIDGKLERSLPSSHLADRQRHAKQHERQRGYLRNRAIRNRRGRDGFQRSRSIRMIDVNMSQSSNDTFPTAMNIAARDSSRRQVVARGARPAASARREGRRFRLHRQDRAHAFAGRHARSRWARNSPAMWPFIDADIQPH